MAFSPKKNILGSTWEWVKSMNRRFWLLKYLVAAVLTLGVTLFSGDKTLLGYLDLRERERYIQTEIKRERTIYERDSIRVSELKELGVGVEEIARERYLMHAPGEEVFIIKRPDSLAKE